MAAPSPARSLLFGLPAVLIAVLSVFLIGTYVDHFAGHALGANGVAVAGGLIALLLAMAFPLLIASRLIQSIGQERVHQSAVRGTVLAVWNGLLIGGLVGLAPTHTADALRAGGAWLPGTGATPIPELARVAGDLLYPARRKEVPRFPTEAPAPTPKPAAPVDAAESTVTVEVAGDRQLSAAELFEQRADGVVVVKTRAKVDESGPLGELFKMMGQTVREGHGSGFVVAPDLVVTNEHVVDSADELAIVTRDGRTLGPVEALVIDPDHDLALLRVEGLSLPKVPLAAADPIPPVGTDTFAIGAPLGLSHSLTRGIVSAHRDVQGTAFLQMQTTVAPGSSGGPLFDDHGRVVAVNTATRSPGLNLAVQVRYVHDLLAAERTPRAYASWAPELEVRSLDVEGVDLRPTEREGVASILQMVANTAMGCAESVPENAQLVLTAPLKMGGNPTVAGNLSDDALACIDSGLLVATGALQMTAMQLHVKESVTIHAQLVRGDDTLDLTVQLGAPKPADAPAPQDASKPEQPTTSPPE